MKSRMKAVVWVLPFLLSMGIVGCGEETEDAQTAFENARNEAVRLRAALEEAIELVQSEHNKALLALNLGARGDVKGAAQGLQRAVSNLKRAYIDYNAAWDKLNDIAEQHPEVWVENGGDQLAQADLDLRETADPLIEKSSASLTELNQLFAKPSGNGGGGGSGGGGGGGGPSIGGTDIDPDSPAGQLLAELVGDYDFVKAEATFPDGEELTLKPPTLKGSMTIKANGRIEQEFSVGDIKIDIKGTIIDIRVDEKVIVIENDHANIDSILDFTWDGELFATIWTQGGAKNVETWRKLRGIGG